MSIAGLLINMKLLNIRIEPKMRKFYVITITVAAVLCYCAICYAGVLARVVYWSKLSASGGEDSKWNTVLIASEFCLLIMAFYNLVDIVIKGFVFTSSEIFFHDW